MSPSLVRPRTLIIPQPARPVIVVPAAPQPPAVLPSREDMRVTWDYDGGCFTYLGNGRWQQSDGTLTCDYEEDCRTANYVQITAADGSGVSFALYSGYCRQFDAAANAWQTACDGNWR
jgi:hypothetical protein